MIIIIDNYDSFTYNLVQYLGAFGEELKVYRNDQITPDEIRKLRPDKLVISPGPCTPREAGISCAVLEQLSPEIPTLGVCLGHQSIGAVYGGVVKRNYRLMHGKTSMIHHTDKGIFQGVANPFEAARYHSLVIERETFPEKELEITAWTEENEIMGVQHRRYPIYGVQFHPESILTPEGIKILQNFVKLGK
jgi:anthranilate synthase/aminodeoxychorismate synthase-like glutamine amidotransferase